MVRTLALLVSVSLFALVGCGGSSNPAQADCRDLVANHICPAVTTCGYYTTVGACISAVEGPNGLDCSAVHSENGNVALCEYDIDTSSCAYLYTTLPASCVPVFYQ